MPKRTLRDSTPGGYTARRNGQGAWMNWVDLAVLGVTLLSGLLGALRGFVREVLGIAAWVAAAFIASPYGLFPTVQPWARAQVSDPGVGDILAFAVVFLVALLVLWIVVGAVSSRVRRSALGGLDRTFGLVFGMARGAVLMCLAYIVAGLVVPTEHWPVPVLESRALFPAYRGAEWLAAQVPPPYRPAVGQPPAGRTADAAALLHATPAGRALSPRPARE